MIRASVGATIAVPNEAVNGSSEQALYNTDSNGEYYSAHENEDAETLQEQDRSTYIVDKIIGHREVNGDMQYLVH